MCTLLPETEQADGPEPALGAADPDHVLVHQKADLLAAELLPPRLCRRRRKTEASERSHNHSTHD